MNDTIREHPLKGQFDTAKATWQVLTRPDGTAANLEIGFTDNGLVGLRTVDDPTGAVLIYTGDEWEAFVDGVKNNEFDLAVLEADARRAREHEQDLRDTGRLRPGRAATGPVDMPTLEWEGSLGDAVIAAREEERA